MAMLMLFAMLWLFIAAAVREQSLTHQEEVAQDSLEEERFAQNKSTVVLKRTYAQADLTASGLPLPLPGLKRRGTPDLPEPWQKKLVLDQVLGKGSFGHVWSARVTCNPDPDVYVAVKYCEDPCSESEFELLETLDNSGLVKGYAHVGGSWSSMELLGDELFDVVTSSPEPLSDAQQAQYVADILGGLAELHRNGLIHRDIKPENIFVTLDHSHVKLGDFGMLCCNKGNASLVKKTNCMYNGAPIGIQCSGASGTPHYLSPSTARKIVQRRKGVQTERDDLWAVGVVAHLLVHNALPKELEWTNEDDLGTRELVRGLAEIGPPGEEYILPRPDAGASSRDVLLFHLLCAGDNCDLYEDEPFTTEKALELSMDWLSSVKGDSSSADAQPPMADSIRECLK